MAAIIVHYFVIAPVLRKLRNSEPFSSQAIQDRRVAVLDFIAAALFADREAGVRLAATIGSESKAAHPRSLLLRNDGALPHGDIHENK